MTTSRKVALACVTSAILLALSIPIYTGALKVNAAQGLSTDVDINIVEPVAGGGLVQINVFTQGGTVPSSLILGVDADVETIMGGNPELPTVDGVDFALNGTLDTGARTLTGADDVNAGVAFARAFSDWGGAINVAAGTFTAFTPAGGMIEPTFTSSSVLRALVTISGYYVGSARAAGSVNGFADYDFIDVDTAVYDAADVDANGDNKPDAGGLIAVPSGQIQGTGASGGIMITVWKDIVTGLRGVGATASAQILTSDGLVDVEVTSPGLTAILGVASLAGIYDSYDQGRLIMSIATTPTDLLNDTSDPLSEFDPLDGSPPQGLFTLANVLIRDSTDPINRWLNVDDLAGGGELDISLSGIGIQTALTNLGTSTEINIYEYNTTVEQDVNGLLLDTGDGNGWDVNGTTALARVLAAGGEDEIFATVDKGSSIIASNATPAVSAGGGGGGSNGICFIATAAYGTPLADDIHVLRAVRDSFMLNTAAGSAFVDAYYRISPPIADAVADNAVLRSIVRTLLVPVIIVSSFVMAMPGLSLVLVLMAGVFAVARLRRRIAQV